MDMSHVQNKILIVQAAKKNHTASNTTYSDMLN